MSKSHKSIIYWIIAIIVIAAIVAGIYWLTSHKALQQEFQSVPNVTIYTVKPSTLTEKIEALGRARANESVTLTANVVERVEKFNFDDGMLVKKGDVLVELTTQEEEAQLIEAKARNIEAEKQYERIEKLAKTRVATKQQLDNQLATMKASEAKIKEIQARIKDRTIVAPFNGILGFRKVSVGTLVEPGNEIATLDDIEKIKVDFTVPERYLGLIKPGMKILATSVAYPDQDFKGEIKTISSRIDPITRSITVRALIPNQKLELKPGMLMSIDIMSKTYSALMIPETAVIQIKDKKYVYVLQADNTVKQTEIKTGMRQDSDIDVITGLKAGDKVVVEGAFKLSPNQKVNVVSSS